MHEFLHKALELGLETFMKMLFSSLGKLWEHFETAVKGQCVSKKAVIWEK